MGKYNVELHASKSALPRASYPSYARTQQTSPLRGSQLGQPLSWPSLRCLDDVLPLPVTPKLPPKLPRRQLGGFTHTIQRVGAGTGRGLFCSRLTPLHPSMERRAAAVPCVPLLHVRKYLSQKQTPSPRPSLPACLSHPDPPSDSFTTSPAAAIPSATSLKFPPFNCFTSSRPSSSTSHYPGLRPIFFFHLFFSVVF